MTLKTRRFLFFSFLLIFVIITPLISLYAAGYSFSNGFKIQKTGILILDSDPTGAKIFINDKIQQKFINKLLKNDEGFIETPAKIKNIKPKTYDVRLTLDGYWPWEKKLKIEPGQSTFSENIILFKKDLPLKMIDGKINSISLSPDKKYLTAKLEDKIYLLNLENDKIEEISTTTNSELQNCTWSPNSKKFLLNNQLCDANNTLKKELLLPLAGIKAENIQWDTKNENKIFYSLENAIFLFDLSNNENKLIFSDKTISDYFSRDNYLFYVEKINNQSLLNVFDINKNINIKTVSLPSSDYTFWNTSHDLLNLYDSKYNILYLIDPFSSLRPLRDTISNVTETFWVNNNILLYANNFEIWTYDLSIFNKKLITRISDKINTIFWNNEKNFVVYSTEKSINVIDLDTKDKYSSTKLFEIDTIKNLQINKQGDTLYFYSKIGNQEGLYKLSIQ